MKKEEVTKWLKIMKANLNSFPEVSNAKKIEALAEAIRLLKNEQSKEPSGSEITTSSDDCISRQDVLSEIIRFSTEEGASVECQQLYCDVNNMPSVTPIKPKGHWQKIELPSRDAHECSECCGLALLDENNEQLTDFCPNCGADMRTSEENDEFVRNDVIDAWMPLPKPYREVLEDGEDNN